jgi:hypothetical protein
LDLLRNEGYLAAVVEKFNHFAGPPDKRCKACGKNRVGIRQDLFGFADIIAVNAQTGKTLAVQTTAAASLSDRRRKVLDSGEAMICMAAGWKLELHGWAQRKIKRGGKAFRYEVIREKLN